MDKKDRLELIDLHMDEVTQWLNDIIRGAKVNAEGFGKNIEALRSVARMLNATADEFEKTKASLENLGRTAEYRWVDDEKKS